MNEASATSEKQLQELTVLAIETSCDETSAAVLVGGKKVSSNVVYSQIESHEKFGGVVPEVASRSHLQQAPQIINAAIERAGTARDEIDVVAATNGPGLIGPLLVGVSIGKALAATWRKPFVGVNHVEGHMFAVSLEHNVEPPFVILLVAGGHTQIVNVKNYGDYEILGSTIDDAAGEAYDKVARYLDLGYPGGPIIDSLADSGDPNAVRFPRAMPGDNFDFSFSGLKTAVINYVRKNPDVPVADIAASFQAAVVDVLVTKTIKAASSIGATAVCLGGGVAANSLLRQELASKASENRINCYLPSPEFCTDNAAMIAAAATWRYQKFGPSPDDVGATPSVSLTGN